jgi:exo-beta-1,3-glucanase (GH17 family)
VATDLQQITGYQVIRLYGTDCNQVANVIAATKGTVKLFLGIFDINSIPSEIHTLTSALNGNWALVNTINVGNELVNAGGATPAQVTAAIGTARTLLKTAGYAGPVVTVDTMVAMKANPELCAASDFCAINCHAFFDGNTLPSAAGAFVRGWAAQVAAAAGGGKTVVVTESGWPTRGVKNKLAEPSRENHEAAIASLKAEFGGGRDLILYGMYNDCWKKDGPMTHGAEVC